jgi:hypothetical protein
LRACGVYFFGWFLSLKVCPIPAETNRIPTIRSPSSQGIFCKKSFVIAVVNDNIFLAWLASML